jgi:hypothetical protein
MAVEQGICSICGKYFANCACLGNAAAAHPTPAAPPCPNCERLADLAKRAVAAAEKHLNRLREVSRQVATLRDMTTDAFEQICAEQTEAIRLREALEWIDQNCSLASDPVAWQHAHRALNALAAQAPGDKPTPPKGKP